MLYIYICLKLAKAKFCSSNSDFFIIPRATPGSSVSITLRHSKNKVEGFELLLQTQIF